VLKIQKLYDYVDNIKTRKEVDMYSIANITLIINPYSTDFPKSFLFEKTVKQNKLIAFVANTVEFYARSFLQFLGYIQTFLYFKFLYRKKYQVKKQDLILDVFVSVNKTIQEGEFNENYFLPLYDVLRQKSINSIFIPRLYNLSTNPFKLHNQLFKFFKIINKDESHFLFEFELLSVKDFLHLLWLTICYPFKTLRLIVKEQQQQDVVFNAHLLKDISRQSISSFTRYILGKKIAKISNISKVYSWCEFQVLERTFNYAIRKNSDIKIFGCQFLINYPVYFNSHVQDIDEINGYAPHKILVNGSYYLIKRERVDYRLGVSLRYQKVFERPRKGTKTNVLLMGSYLVDETKSMLQIVGGLDKVQFKGHPEININAFQDVMSENIEVTNRNIYELFPDTAVIIGSATGSLAEAVACGVSVVVVAQKNELITNPLTDIGKGKIWDIVFNEIELEQKMKQLLHFRSSNMSEIDSIADWYKDNLFVVPCEENIIRAFDLDKY